MTGTRTYAALDVPRTVYAAIRALLHRAGYDHAFHPRPDGEVIDMHGIALRAAEAPPEGGQIVTSSLLSAATKEGRVELAVDGALVQMDLPKAREVVAMLQQAIEAATSDQMFYTFLTERLGMSPEVASHAMLDFREIRQGSRTTVFPH